MVVFSTGTGFNPQPENLQMVIFLSSQSYEIISRKYCQNMTSMCAGVLKLTYNRSRLILQ